MSIIKLVAIDLDGTLLRRDGSMSQRNIEAIRKAISSGVEIVLASGRMFRTMRPYAEQLGLTGLIIAYNGALVKDIVSGESIWHRPIEPHISNEMIDFCLENDVHLNFYLDDQVYVHRIGRWSNLYDSRTGARSIERDLRSFRGETPTKLQVIDAADRIDQLLDIFKGFIDSKLSVMNTMPEYIEFIDKRVSKGVALQELMTNMGVERSECAAIGDSCNDIPMFDVAGLRFAVANALDDVKKRATHLVRSNDNDGVADAIDLILG